MLAVGLTRDAAGVAGDERDEHELRRPLARRRAGRARCARRSGTPTASTDTVATTQSEAEAAGEPGDDDGREQARRRTASPSSQSQPRQATWMATSANTAMTPDESFVIADGAQGSEDSRTRRSRGPIRPKSTPCLAGRQRQGAVLRLWFPTERRGSPTGRAPTRSCGSSRPISRSRLRSSAPRAGDRL